MGAKRKLKVSQAFSKALGFQRAKPFGRARRREIPQAVPFGGEAANDSPE